MNQPPQDLTQQAMNDKANAEQCRQNLPSHTLGGVSMVDSMSAQGNNYQNRSLVSTQLASTSFATASDFEAWRRIPTETALAILQERGGHPGALAEAALLCIKKSQDYNPGQTDAHNVDRVSYFPFGATSYAQMLHTKSNRFISIVQKQRAGDGANFESLRDTALDIINYAGFYLADPRTPK